MQSEPHETFPPQMAQAEIQTPPADTATAPQPAVSTAIGAPAGGDYANGSDTCPNKTSRARAVE